MTVGHPVTRMRLLVAGDRERVETMTRAAGLFWDHEIGIALEVFDAATGVGGTIDPDYETAGVDCDGTLAAWACWGPVPAEPTSFDLYWIVVDPAMQGHGLGTQLLAEMDHRIAGRARRVLVETSGRPDYARTRAFYERHGYRPIARVADHFAPGDDLVRYAKDVEQ